MNGSGTGTKKKRGSTGAFKEELGLKVHHEEVVSQGDDTMNIKPILYVDWKARVDGLSQFDMKRKMKDDEEF